MVVVLMVSGMVLFDDRGVHSGYKGLSGVLRSLPIGVVFC